MTRTRCALCGRLLDDDQEGKGNTCARCVRRLHREQRRLPVLATVDLRVAGTTYHGEGPTLLRALAAAGPVGQEEPA